MPTQGENMAYLYTWKEEDLSGIRGIFRLDGMNSNVLAKMDHQYILKYIEGVLACETILTPDGHAALGTLVSVVDQQIRAAEACTCPGKDQRLALTS